MAIPFAFRHKQASQGGSEKSHDALPEWTDNLIVSRLPKGSQLGKTPEDNVDSWKRQYGAGVLGLERTWDGVKWVFRKRNKLDVPKHPSNAEDPYDVQMNAQLKGAARQGSLWGSTTAKNAQKQMQARAKARTNMSRNVTVHTTPKYAGALSPKEVPFSQKDIMRDKGFGVGGLQLQAPTDVTVRNWSDRSIEPVHQPQHFTMPSQNNFTYKHDHPTDRVGFWQDNTNVQPQKTSQNVDARQTAQFNFYTNRYTTSARFSDDVIKPVSHAPVASRSALARWVGADHYASSQSIASTTGKRKLQELEGRGYVPGAKKEAKRWAGPTAM